MTGRWASALVALVALCAAAPTQLASSGKPNQPFNFAALGFVPGSNPTSFGSPFASLFPLFRPPSPPARKPEPKSESSFAKVTMTGAEFKAFCHDQMAVAEEAIGKIVNDPKLSKVSLLSFVNKLDVAIANAASLSSLLAQVHPEASVRDEAVACELATHSFTTKLALDQVLYNKAKGVAADPPTDALEERRFDKLMTMFRRSGVTLDDKARDKVQALSEEIQKLSTEFELNLSADTRYVKRKVTDANALKGLGQDFIREHTKGDQVVISTDYPDIQPALKHAADAELRKDLYSVMHQRGYPKNIPILEKVLSLRHELATVLGYASYADYATENMMVKSANNVDAFITNIAEVVKKGSDEEVQILLAEKRLDDPKAERVEAYDASYYMERIRSRLFSVDSNEIASYFTYDTTRSGLFALVTRLYGVKFVPSKISVWHSDVQAYDVYWTRDPLHSGVIGRVFLDMFPRDNKYKHAAQFPIRAGVLGVQLPEGALVCNFPKSGAMEHSHVDTFFHEFGHLMHHIIGGQDQAWAEFSGVATEWDFVEAPSQMFEEWATHAPTLQTFAIHPETKQPIPSDLVKKLKNSAVFGRRIQARQQLFYARLSLSLHLAPPPPDANGRPIDSTAIMLKLQNEFAPYAYVDNTFFHASFGHLMGYSAVYYTYMWSQTLAKQMLSVFEAAPSMVDEDVAIRYRDYVLRPGGKLPASALVFNFVGAPFSYEPFYAWLNEQPIQPQPEAQPVAAKTSAQKSR
eukprot:c52357_g1_i1.p1 GENE.c52357_g1_i1~~c52357_g1_i1.p1  ORF type:complete len:748 (-),score=178.36 c52357_g1_i1:690-2933(-)